MIKNEYSWIFEPKKNEKMDEWIEKEQYFGMLEYKSDLFFIQINGDHEAPQILNCQALVYIEGLEHPFSYGGKIDLEILKDVCLKMARGATS